MDVKMWSWGCFLWVFLCSSYTLPCCRGQQIGDTEVIFDWLELDYDYPTPEDRENAIADGSFIPHNNIMCGVKVFGDDVYVTTPRWLPGVPSTMNKVVIKDGRPLLQPFPSWDWQEQDNCEVFQFTQSMEIDPATGYMWILDNGRLNTWASEGEIINACPAKLVVYDLINQQVVHTHTFPDDVLSFTGNEVNDIVLERSGYAYMTDVGIGASGFAGGLVVYNHNTYTSHRLEHESMLMEPDGNVITINGTDYPFDAGSDGIALSPDGTQLFYCPLGGYHLYQLPTDIAKQEGIDIDPYVRDMGEKPSQTDGMTMGHERLYYGGLSTSTVYGWEYKIDMEEQNLPLDQVEMITITELSQDVSTMVWPDTFGMDGEGWLWVTPNRLALFNAGDMDWTGQSGSNFRVSKIYVADKSYQVEVDVKKDV